MENEDGDDVVAQGEEEITAVESNWEIMLILYPHKLGSSMFLNSSPFSLLSASALREWSV